MEKENGLQTSPILFSFYGIQNFKNNSKQNKIKKSHTQTTLINTNMIKWRELSPFQIERIQIL